MKTSTGHVLWLDPGFGASGDMMLGALIGLGAPLAEIRDGLASLAVEGWSIGEESVQRSSLRCTRAVVDSSEDHHHRTWSSIDAMLAAAGFPEPVESGARSTFRRLGEVEAGIHGVSIDEVHFHEVGAVDAIVDIVGSWLALASLGIDRVVCGSIGLGHGTTEAAHGRLPVPAPATSELLIGADVHPVDVAAETITPTGAALLTTMAAEFGPIPGGRLLATARGAGGRDPSHYPNALSAYLLESASAAPTPQQVQAVVLSTNLDDVTAEIVGHTINRCLEAGADDAWATPITMKKSRPGVELNVLCSPDLVADMATLVFAETATLGLRTTSVTKHVQPRRYERVIVRGHAIDIKVGPHGAKPEHDQLVAAADALETTVRELAAETLATFQAGFTEVTTETIADSELAKSEIYSQTRT